MFTADFFELFGRIAGIGGLAIAATMYIFREVIRRNVFSNLGSENSYKIMKHLLYFVWSIAVLGIFTWGTLEVVKHIYKREPKPITQLSVPSQPVEPEVGAKNCGYSLQNAPYLSARPSLVIKCAQNHQQEREFSADTIKTAYFYLRRFSDQKSENFLPSQDAYLANPSPVTWSFLMMQTDEIMKIIEVTRDAVVSYLATLTPEKLDEFHRTRRLLSKEEQGYLFSQYHQESIRPPNNDYLKYLEYWARDYTFSIEKMIDELEIFIKTIERTSSKK